MGSLLNTLWRSAILDEAAIMEWRERPNVFLRGIVLIILVTLIAEIAVFGVNLVNQVQPIDLTAMEESMDSWYDNQLQWMPEMEPEAEKAWETMQDMMDVMVPMIRDISRVDTPLPRGITGVLTAVGSWLSRSVAAIGGWLFYGALVLIMVRLLGGSVKLPVFLGSVALYIIPGLLALFQPIPCIGPLLAFVGLVWSVIVYVKATSVVSSLETGHAIIAVVAPFLILLLLGSLVFGIMVVWLAVIF